MKRMFGRLGQRAAVVALVAGGLLLGAADVAGAHVEATAEGAQAGAGPVTVIFLAEAESTTSGIVGVKTQLPGGVLPEWVTLTSGPAGWTLSPTADGYEIGGPDIGPGVDLTFSITIAQLPPDIDELPLKTLVFYADGQEDAWIELATESNPEPANPAPVVAVAPAPAGASSASTSGPESATTTTSRGPTFGAADDSAAEPAQDATGRSGAVAVAVFGMAAVAVAGGLWFWKSRTRRRP